MVTAGEITAGDLQVAPVKVAMMESDDSIDRYLFGGAAAHVVVAFL